MPRLSARPLTPWLLLVLLTACALPRPGQLFPGGPLSRPSEATVASEGLESGRPSVEEFVPGSQATALLRGVVRAKGLGTVAGATVTAYATSEGSPAPKVGTPPGHSAVAGPSASPRASTTTDADGQFSLELAAGSYSLLVRQAGSNLAAVHFGVQAGTVVDIDLVPTGEVRGRLLGPDGIELGGSDVYVPGTDLVARSDDAGYFLLKGVPAGRYCVVARPPLEGPLHENLLARAVSPPFEMSAAGNWRASVNVPLTWKWQPPGTTLPDSVALGKAGPLSFVPHPDAVYYRLTLLNTRGRVLGQTYAQEARIEWPLPLGDEDYGFFRLEYLTSLGPERSWGSIPATPQMFEVPLSSQFVHVPAGTFVMGQRGIDPDVQYVTISKGFMMQRTPVTRAQWHALMGIQDVVFPECPSCPMTRINWYDAIAYANAMSRNQGLPEAYDEVGQLLGPLQEVTGYRLPTEAEWEHACRAGTATTWYSGSDESAVNAIAWTVENAGGRPHPVGLKQPNAWGLYDMSGNVYEWAYDGHDRYSGGSVTDPVGTAKWIVRGGSWLFSALDARSSGRYVMPSSTQRDIDVGFRLVRSAAGHTGPFRKPSYSPEVNRYPESATVTGRIVWQGYPSLFQNLTHAAVGDAPGSVHAGDIAYSDGEGYFALNGYAPGTRVQVGLSAGTDEAATEGDLDSASFMAFDAIIAIASPDRSVPMFQADAYWPLTPSPGLNGSTAGQFSFRGLQETGLTYEVTVASPSLALSRTWAIPEGKTSLDLTADEEFAALPPGAYTWQVRYFRTGSVYGADTMHGISRRVPFVKE